MRKYRIYSGTKPSSVNKTFAVNWGNKYFTVSPIVGKESLAPITYNSLTANGTKLTLSYTNSNMDSVQAVPYSWYCSNPDVNSGSEQMNSFSDTAPRTLGPYSSGTYSWDVASAIKPGKNTISAGFSVDPVASYQNGAAPAKSGSVVVYKKFQKPDVEVVNLSFNNKIYNSSGPWPFGFEKKALDSYSYAVKIKNPNEISAAYYLNSSKKTIISSGSSTTEDKTSIAMMTTAISDSVSSNSISRGKYYLDSSVSTTSAQTKSDGAVASYTIPAPPQLVSCLPTSPSTNSFQVTVKNPNPSQYYCRVSYSRYNGNGSNYLMANCPANGTGTMINTSGSAATFSLVRGAEYVISLYFYTLNGASLSYSGTQRSRTIHYPFKAPDSGYSYVSPIISGITYDDPDNPRTVTFTIRNNNNISLGAQMDLFEGSAESGTLVDYWKVTTPGWGTATCPNTWPVSPNSTYTLRCYFMSSSSSYHGTALSGYVDYLFITEGRT